MYDQQLHRKQVSDFLKIDEIPQDIRANVGNITQALYTCSELGLWPDHVNSVSVEQALACWAIVERMRAVRFPDELRI